MFSLLTNLAKAAVAVAATPVAVVADVLTIPETSTDPHKGMFDKTARVLGQAKEAFDAAVDPKETK